MCGGYREKNGDHISAERLIEQLRGQIAAMQTMALSTGHYTADQESLVRENNQLRAAERQSEGEIERRMAKIDELCAEVKRLRALNETDRESYTRVLKEKNDEVKQLRADGLIMVAEADRLVEEGNTVEAEVKRLRAEIEAERETTARWHEVAQAEYAEKCAEVDRLRAELQEANEALDADWDIRIDEEKAKNEQLRSANEKNKAYVLELEAEVKRLQAEGHEVLAHAEFLTPYARGVRDDFRAALKGGGEVEQLKAEKAATCKGYHGFDELSESDLHVTIEQLEAVIDDLLSFRGTPREVEAWERARKVLEGGRER
jgi:chromosome segregation ATPase